MSARLLAPTAVLLLGSTFEALFGCYLDYILVLAFTLWGERAAIIDSAGSLFGDDVTSVILNAVLAVAVALIWSRLRLSLVLGSRGKQGQWTGVGKPVLIPARTTHRRIFPEKHAFSYSYLVVGVPVGWEGSSGSMVSTNSPDDEQDSFWFPTRPSPAKAWFHVDGADHLGRGTGTLKTKLDGYLSSQVSTHPALSGGTPLTSQGVDPASYPHAFLVTAASFMGYNFNPVSFWYLYSATKELTAMILEVNNTFGERRMYLLAANGGEGGSSVAQGKPCRFTHAWPKDFHVSPFNSRKGSYSLVAHDILAEANDSPVGILDGTITLKSSKDHAKIVARLFSEGTPVDPTTMGIFEKAMFIMRWWWVGFNTFPRIVKEAAKLFYQRKLHVWFRPEPRESTISRVADSSERQLEPIFRSYLRHLVDKSSAKMQLTYVPAGGMGAEEVMGGGAATDVGAGSVSRSRDASFSVAAASDLDQTEFRVLTPAFYTRFVHYAHDFEAIFAELRENKTISVSRPEMLPQLFVSKSPAAPLAVDNARDGLCFRAIKALRRLPERIERPLTSSASPATASTATHTVTDVRGFRLSAMDGYVLTHTDDSVRCAYEEAVLRTFLAERLALGSTGLLRIQEILLRAVLAWTVSWGLCNVAEQAVGRLETA